MGATAKSPLGSRWFLFCAMALLLVLAAVELGAWVARQMLGGSELHADVTEYLPPRPQGKPIRDRLTGLHEVLHPYVGFVLGPTKPEQQSSTDLGWRQEVLHQRRADRLIVAVVGGSVARQLQSIGADALREELERIPRFEGRRVTIVALGLGGYKQPQQLTIVSYLLTLGGEFDVVVNLDGFNEVAPHAHENGAKGVFPAFPRWWQRRVPDVPNVEMSARSAALARGPRPSTRSLGRIGSSAKTRPMSTS